MTNQLEYNTTWLPNAIPMVNSKLAKCQRYERHSEFVEFNRGFCEKETFNTSSIVDCGHYGFVYKTDEVSIQKEVCFCAKILFYSHFVVLIKIFLNALVQYDMCGK